MLKERPYWRLLLMLTDLEPFSFVILVITLVYMNVTIIVKI